MAWKGLITRIFLGLVLSFVFMRPVFSADLEWNTIKQLNLDTSPIDVSASLDGKWIFILTPGKILVYSVPEGRMVKEIAVEKKFDRLTHSPRTNTLVLTSRAGKTVRMIQLELIHRIDVSGLPFEGPEHAPVTVVVFGEYQ